MSGLNFLNQLYAYNSYAYDSKLKISVDPQKIIIKNPHDWSVSMNREKHCMSIAGVVPNRILSFCSKYNNTDMKFRRQNNSKDSLIYLYHKLLKVAKQWGYISCEASTTDYNTPRHVNYGLHLIYLTFDPDLVHLSKTHQQKLDHREWPSGVCIDTRKDQCRVSFDDLDCTFRTSLDLPKPLKEAIIVFIKCNNHIELNKYMKSHKHDA